MGIWPFKRRKQQEEAVSDFVPEEVPQPRQATVAPASAPQAAPVAAPEPVAVASPLLVGDLNGDGVVDEDDVLIAEMERAAELVAVRVSQTSESSNAALISAQAEASEERRFRAESDARAERAEHDVAAANKRIAKLQAALRRATERLRNLAEG